MLRSPFFCFLIFIFFLSCKENTTVSVKFNPINKEAFLLQKKALIHFENNNFNNAFYYFNKSKIASEIVKDSANIAFNLIQMATVQQVNGDYYGSKETLTEALPYIKNFNNYLTAAHNLFGIADKELSIYDDAVFNYKEAIKNAKDIVAKQSPLQNIAVVYIQQKKYNKAIEILESILHKKTLDKIEFVKNKARVLDNLGYAYFKNGLAEKGLFLMKKSLKLRNQEDDSYGSIESNLHLAEYYVKIDAEKSNRFAETAYQIATKFNSIDERLKALSFLISNDSNTKNNHYAQKYIFLNDSIIKIRNNFKNKFAKIKYDSKKEKEENQQLRLEKAENLLYLQEVKFQKILFIIGIISLISSIIYLSKYYRNKNRTVKIKASYDAETRISKKIHDELANDVFHVIAFTETQSLAKENIKETLLQKLDQIYIRVRGISRENSDIDLGVNYSINLKEILATYSNNATNVIIESIEKINWETIDEIKKIAIYRVLQELMVNMKKHSLATLVVVKFDYNQKRIFMEYVDNGKGCLKNKIIKNGLQNMENRILAIKGTIIFDTEPDKGFKVKITLPK
jgi:signal transduction histidine kinase